MPGPRPCEDDLSETSTNSLSITNSTRAAPVHRLDEIYWARPPPLRSAADTNVALQDRIALRIRKLFAGQSRHWRQAGPLFRPS
jgi:hypothetical protein